MGERSALLNSLVCCARRNVSLAHVLSISIYSQRDRERERERERANRLLVHYSVRVATLFICPAFVFLTEFPLFAMLALINQTSRMSTWFLRLSISWHLIYVYTHTYIYIYKISLDRQCKISSSLFFRLMRCAPENRRARTMPFYLDVE